jgi:dTDP-4-dehydrorhamnose reductase
MKSLVLGASGQVGGAICALLSDSECVGSYAGANISTAQKGMVHIDLAEDDCAAAIEAIAPSHIYLASSYTNVDGCELDPERSYQVNVAGVKRVAAVAKSLGARLIYFSSDYVFDGSAGPYAEEDLVAPISVYGRHKALAEQICLQLADSAVVRTTVVYGPELQQKNFVYRLIKTLGAGETLKVPADQVGNPTYNPNLAQAAVELGQSKLVGIFNLAGSERVSRYEFALEAARVFNLPIDLILPVSTASFNQPARRPLAGGMKLGKAKSALKTELIGYRAGLRLFREMNCY